MVEETGRGTSLADMPTTGIWGVRDLKESRAESGRMETERFVKAAVGFIDKWNELRPYAGKK